jgi:nitrite reductase/ring-hydroxylating ferredoxin subunit
LFHWIRIFESVDDYERYLQPGTIMTFDLRGEKICVTRTQRGTYAVQDRCPHNGASLSQGMCSVNNEIVCPLHRYSFDLESGKATSGGAYALKTYPIRVQADGVYLGFKSRWWEF